jgi:hypothetical protein
VIKRSAFCVLLSAEAAILAALGCDPNVVIGSYPTNGGTSDGGTQPTGGMPTAGAGTAGSTSAAGGGSGGSAGSTPAEAGAAGDGGTAGTMPIQTLLWSADHEAADMSDWEPEGGYYSTNDAPVISDARAHGGQYAVEFTIDTTDRTDKVVRVYRSTVDQPAYYSAWFFLEQDHVPDNWWSIFVFLTASDLQDPDTLDSVWDLNLRHTDEGLMPYLYDHLTGENSDEGTVAVPVGEWVHLEFYFAYAPPSDGELRLWVNGALSVEALGLGEAAEPYLAFSLGNGSNGLTPDVSTIYVDDAAISTVRLGP